MGTTPIKAVFNEKKGQGKRRKEKEGRGIIFFSFSRG